MTGPAPNTPTPGDPTLYEIRVAGHLDDHWSVLLGGLTLARCPDGTTTLIGAVADQAQLHGVLAARFANDIAKRVHDHDARSDGLDGFNDLLQDGAQILLQNHVAQV